MPTREQLSNMSQEEFEEHVIKALKRLAETRLTPWYCLYDERLLAQPKKGD